jgi:hypothetical protein
MGSSHRPERQDLQRSVCGTGLVVDRPDLVYQRQMFALMLESAAVWLRLSGYAAPRPASSRSGDGGSPREAGN